MYFSFMLTSVWSIRSR